MARGIVFLVLMFLAASRPSLGEPNGPGGPNQNQNVQEELQLLFQVQSEVNKTKIQIVNAVANLTTDMSLAASIGSTLSSLQARVEAAMSSFNSELGSAMSTLSDLEAGHAQGLTVSNLNTTGAGLSTTLEALSSLATYMMQNANPSGGPGGPGGP